MRTETNKVSLGLPVFNGEKYLAKALDSILSQTYPNFELIISDNASTDNTRQICLEYVKKDNRINYYRNDTNLGASRNFNRVFSLSTGKYFKWANYDDLHAPDYLSRCVEILERDSSAVLCHCQVGKINEFGELVGKYHVDIKSSSPKMQERFGSIINFRNNGWLLIHGLMRTDALKKTRLFGDYICADTNLVAEMVLVGRVHQISKMLFYRRAHSQSYTDKNYVDLQEKLNWWTIVGPVKLAFPYWRICLEYFQSVRHMTLKWYERQLCYVEIGKWLLKEGLLLMSLDIVYNTFNRFHVSKRFSSFWNCLQRPFKQD